MAAGVTAEVMLAYSRPTVFAVLQVPAGDMRQIFTVVLRRAQQLGLRADHLRIARIAKVDLDEAPGIETIVEASSWPPPGSNDQVQPHDFAGVFVLSESGALLGEKLQTPGREDVGSGFSQEIMAIAKNPFDGAWDFLIDRKYLSAPIADDDDDELDEDNDEVGEAETSSSQPEQTFYRWIQIQRYSAGQFEHRKGMDWIQSKTCLGADCFN